MRGVIKLMGKCGMQETRPDPAQVQNSLQISYLPYLFLCATESVDFDEISVWNFGLLSVDRIPDCELRKHVKKLLAAHRSNGARIKDIGIISFKNKEHFQPLTKLEQQRVVDLRRVLFLSSVAKSNISIGPNMGMFMVTSDNFSALYQNFALGSSDTAWSSGKIINVGSIGHKVGEIIYEMPRYVLHRSFACDQSLLKALTQFRRKQPRTFRLIMQATDAMMNGYSNSDDISFEARILEQSRAFEILLQLPDKNQREVLKETIEKYCHPDDDKKVSYKYEVRGKKKVEKNSRSRQAMWADRFYTLRNHIIHGKKLSSKDFLFSGQSHFHLALWFFIVAAKKIINETLGKTIFHDVIRYEDGKFEYDKGSMTASIEKAVKNAMLKFRKK